MAESDLSTLLKTLKVTRHEGVWAFQTGGTVNEKAVMAFQEREGLSQIVPADTDTAADNRWIWLELSVFSDLNAVGFLAQVADALTKASIPCNAVAAFHHDHIFVPYAKADKALEALNALSESA